MTKTNIFHRGDFAIEWERRELVVVLSGRMDIVETFDIALEGGDPVKSVYNGTIYGVRHVGDSHGATYLVDESELSVWNWKEFYGVVEPRTGFQLELVATMYCLPMIDTRDLYICNLICKDHLDLENDTEGDFTPTTLQKFICDSEKEAADLMNEFCISHSLAIPQYIHIDGDD